MANKKTTVNEAEQEIHFEGDILSLKKTLQEVIVERDQRVQEVFDRDKEIQKLKSEQEISLKNCQEQIVFKNNQIAANNDAVLNTKKISVELEAKSKQLEILTNKFNELAKIFDEHLKGFDDIIELEKLMVRNSLRTQELMQTKIKAFNGEGEIKK
jgi:hypothetical protein